VGVATRKLADTACNGGSGFMQAIGLLHVLALHLLNLGKAIYKEINKLVIWFIYTYFFPHNIQLDPITQTIL